MRAFICFLVVVCTLFQSQTHADVSTLVNSQISNYDNCWVVDTPFALDKLVLFWTLDTTNDQLSVALATQNQGYIALGWNKNNVDSMLPGDAVIGYTDDSAVGQVLDYNLQGYSSCYGSGSGVCADSVVPGAADNLVNTLLTVNGTYTTMSFTRALDTGDSNDVVITNSNMNMLWALGRTNQIQEHQNKDLFTLNFFTQPSCPPACSTHGTCVKGCCICDIGFSGKDCSVAGNTSTKTLGPQIIPSEYTFHVSLNSDFEIYWKFLGDLIEIAVDVKATGWVGFGPSENGKMINSDAILGWVDDVTGDIVISDNWITAQSGNCPGVCPDSAVGGTNDVIDYNGNQANGRTQLKWLRKLNTGDAKDIVIEDKEMFVVYGYHSNADGLVEHTKKGTVKLNFFKGTATGTTDLKGIHGILMFIAWSVFIPGTSFVARYLKRYSWWFNVHRWVNTVSILGVLAAFGLAIAFSSEHFKSVHAVLGLIVVIGGVVQPVLGVIADRMYDKGRTETPWWPDKVHWIIGWTILTAALVNVELGLVKYGENILVIIYGIWCALVGSFLIAWAIYKKIKNNGSD